MGKVRGGHGDRRVRGGQRPALGGQSLKASSSQTSLRPSFSGTVISGAGSYGSLCSLADVSGFGGLLANSSIEDLACMLAASSPHAERGSAMARSNAGAGASGAAIACTASARTASGSGRSSFDMFGTTSSVASPFQHSPILASLAAAGFVSSPTAHALGRRTTDPHSLAGPCQPILMPGDLRPDFHGRVTKGDGAAAPAVAAVTAPGKERGSDVPLLPTALRVTCAAPGRISSAAGGCAYPNSACNCSYKGPGHHQCLSPGGIPSTVHPHPSLVSGLQSPAGACSMLGSPIFPATSSLPIGGGGGSGGALRDERSWGPLTSRSSGPFASRWSSGDVTPGAERGDAASLRRGYSFGRAASLPFRAAAGTQLSLLAYAEEAVLLQQVYVSSTPSAQTSTDVLAAEGSVDLLGSCLAAHASSSCLSPPGPADL